MNSVKGLSEQYFPTILLTFKVSVDYIIVLQVMHIRSELRKKKMYKVSVERVVNVQGNM